MRKIANSDHAIGATPGRGSVWLQRAAGIVLGGLAGTAAAYSVDFWDAFHSENAGALALESTGGPTTAPIPGADTRQFALSLITRARDLMGRGEIREAERFLAAAEQLEPDSPTLFEMRRLLEVAKAKMELANKAPATGRAPTPQSADAGRPTDASAPATITPAAKFAEGVQQFRARNYTGALAALGLAAESGYAPAQNYLGYMYRHGLGVTQDFARAMTWYQKAAAQNHAGALNNIGYMYRHGLGVEQDYAQAKAWFRRAAERGDAAGQYNLGQMLADGVGAAPDHREAVKWYRTAAEQGHPRAAMGFAHLVAQGLGTNPDPVEAYFWYGVAARSGIEGAQRFRTALGAQLSNNQRQAADARLAGWRYQSADGEGQ